MQLEMMIIVTLSGMIFVKPDPLTHYVCVWIHLKGTFCELLLNTAIRLSGTKIPVNEACLLLVRVGLVLNLFWTRVSMAAW